MDGFMSDGFFIPAVSVTYQPPDDPLDVVVEVDENPVVVVIVEDEDP